MITRLVIIIPGTYEILLVFTFLLHTATVALICPRIFTVYFNIIIFKKFVLPFIFILKVDDYNILVKINCKHFDFLPYYSNVICLLYHIFLTLSQCYIKLETPEDLKMHLHHFCIHEIFKRVFEIA